LGRFLDDLSLCRTAISQTDGRCKMLTIGYWFQTELPPITPSLVNLLYFFLLVFWIDIDSRGRPEIIRPFEYSFLVYIFLLPYLPYYLWRTRGSLGLIMLIGFLVLPILGGLAQLGIELARSV